LDRADIQRLLDQIPSGVPLQNQTIDSSLMLVEYAKV
jgi:hypothetical protein